MRDARFAFVRKVVYCGHVFVVASTTVLQVTIVYWIYAYTVLRLFCSVLIVVPMDGLKLINICMQVY